MYLASTAILEPQQQLFPKRQQSISCHIPKATMTTATTTTDMTTTTATTATAAAGCQQHVFETRHVSSLWYVFVLFLFITNVDVRYVATMAATKAGRIDHDNGHDNKAATAAAGCQQHELEMRHVSSLWYVFLPSFVLFLFITTLMFMLGSERWEQQKQATLTTTSRRLLQQQT
jgi:hypothetical protein